MHFKTSSHSNDCWNVDEIYHLCHNSPKSPRELKAFSNALEKAVPKPSKTYETRWIDHKFQAMRIIFKPFWNIMAHIEPLSQTDS